MVVKSVIGRCSAQWMGSGVDLRSTANRAWVCAAWLVPGLGVGLVQRLAHGQGRLAQRRTWLVAARSTGAGRLGPGLGSHPVGLARKFAALGGNRARRC